ncbi:MAG TPA: hypothetical protein VKB26_13480 [Candidatus Acidoferrales bacterium]|nr:hypothetical protein [Candidatus Acidoferrales bacterium]
MNAGRYKDSLKNADRELDADAAASARPDLKDPNVVLSLLEADQVVAAKQQTRFGRRSLSFGVRLAMWSLRVYVIVMFVIVVISVLRALHGGG